MRRHRVPHPVARRVVHITDVHVGWTTSSAVLGEAAQLATDLRPDVVVLTGDYVNHSLRHLDALAAFVAGLPEPVVAVLGNHDHWSGAGDVTRCLRRGGAAVLRNAWTNVDGLEVVGIDDARTEHHDVERAFRGARAREALVLQHAPRIAPEIAAHGGRLILSGHTHAGHVYAKSVTPRVAKRLGHDYLAGWYPVGGARLYVNAGIGHAPLRFGERAAPEVAVFDLEPA